MIGRPMRWWLACMLLAMVSGCVASLYNQRAYCALQVTQYHHGNITLDSARALVRKNGGALVDTLGGLACVHPVVNIP